jgi:hypothetical protein
VDAKPFLLGIGRHMRDLAFDAVLIGNAAAALQGAPVTTIDFDLLEDIIRSKRAARRPRDLAVLDVLEKTLEEAGRQAGATRRRRPRK